MFEKIHIWKQNLDDAFLYWESVLPPATVISKPTNDNNVVDIVD
jgi:hypothetical protein